MSTDDPIAAVPELSAGAEFHKCAFQVNPHHYAGTYRGQASALDEAGYARALADKAAELGITVLAVTDHNHVGGVDAIRSVARERGISVFPGFELTSAEGVHVLCLYPPETTEEQLKLFLGGFGVATPKPSSDPCEESFSDLLARVCGQGGIPVAAHATNDRGLFKVLQGQTRIRAWRDENLYAVQIPGPVRDLPHEVQLIVRNRNPDYARRYAPEADLALAAVNARDVASPEDLADPSATCWIKMSEVGIEGLRQAFLDPGSRIRLNSDPPPEEHSELVAMAWQGGFLDGAAFRFNPNLNVLVGGRGAGKSTVVESLRYVLGLEPLGEEARSGHAGILKHVLRNGTKVSLLVRGHRPSPRDYRIERTIPNPPVVRDGKSGEVLHVLAADVFPGVEVYGQHEISELTKSPEKLTRLLGRFVERDDSVAHRKRELRRALERERERILGARKELDQIEERLAALPGLEETLERYQEAGLERDLKEQSLLVREERVLGTIPERLQPFRACLEELRQELPIDRAFLSPKALEDLPGKEILAGADRMLEQLNADLEKVAQALDAALASADQGLRGVHERFEVRKARVQSAYEEKLRALQKSRIDGEEFIQLRRRIEALRPLKEREAALGRAEAEYRNHRRNLLAEWEDTKAEEFRALERAGKRVTRKLKGRVRVRVEFGGNRESLFQLLRDGIGGRFVRGDQHPSASGQPVAGCARAGVPSGRRFPRGRIWRLRRAGGTPGASLRRDPDANRRARSSVHHGDRAQHRSPGRAGELAGAGPALHRPEGHRRAAAVAAGVRRAAHRRSTRGRPGQPLHHRRGGAADAQREAAAPVPVLDPQREHPGPRGCRAHRGPQPFGRRGGRQCEDRSGAHGLHRRPAGQKAGGSAARRGRGRLRAPAPQVRVLTSR